MLTSGSDTPPNRTSPRLRGLALAILAAAVLFAAFLVFNPDNELTSDLVRRTGRWLQAHGVWSWLADDDIVEFTANVLLFVPLGLAGRLVVQRGSSRGWLLVGLVLSMVIETVQLLFLPERSWSPLDILANTLGTFLGALVAGRLLSRLRRPAG